jgi:hypothetical protein
MVSPILHALGTMLIVAAGDLADPVGGIARHRRNCGRREAAAEQPQKVPAAALDGIIRPAIPLMELWFGQVWMEADAFWHAPVLQQLPAPPYKPIDPRHNGCSLSSQKIFGAEETPLFLVHR